MLTSGYGEFLRWVSILAYLLCFSSMGEGQQKCPTRVDERFHGIVVDCTSKGLNSSDIPNLDIPINNTTSLILDYNNLEHVINGSFPRLQKLCRLQIDYSGITDIDTDAFSGLAALQVLSLYGNSLDIVGDALRPGVFKHTLSLKELNIGNNTIKSAFRNYANFIDSIDFLPELYYLYITSFPILYIGKEFERLHTLKSLDVYGTYPSTILNNSLEGLENSSITHFKLAYANPFDFETGVFKNLPDTISSLTLFKVSAGNINLLKALERLENRTIPVLHFDGVSLPFTENPRRQIDDGIIEEQNLKYLLNICVYNLTWKNSDVMALDLGFSPTSYFGRCVKSIDISGNRLQLYRPTFITRLASLSHLEELRLSQDGLSKHTVSFWDDRNKDLLETIPQDINQEHEFVDDSHYMSLTTESKRNNSSPDLSSPSNPRNDRYEDKSSDYMRQETQLHLQESTLKKANLLPSNPNNVLFANATKASSFGNSTFIIYLPHNLSYVSFDTLLGFRHINYDYLKFVSPNNGTELYLRYTKSPIVLRCLYLGLHKLRLIDFTGTLLHYIPLSLFDYFPSLQVLVLRQTQEDPGLLQKYGRRLIKNIANLVYLDLSNNGLSVLPEGIFQENRQLRYLCLAKNRFSTIPFQIRLTPSLEMLDLRMNAFSGLDKEEQVDIDKHITSHERKNFTVFMAGNNLQCVCSDISFAAWMQRTHAQFDPKVGRTCLSEGGKEITIGKRNCRV